jgi:hypothetical protein
MTIQYSVPVRNAQLDAVESVIGASAILHFYTGAPPANCAAADTGVLLGTMNLPADWMANAAAGSKVLSGVWAGSGVATGNAGYFRIKDTTDTTTGMQGTVTVTGGGGDLTLNSVAFVAAVPISQNTFTLNAGNA